MMKIEIKKEEDKRIFSHTDCMCAQIDEIENVYGPQSQWKDYNPSECEGTWTRGVIRRDIILTDDEGAPLLSVRETQWRDWGNGQGVEREVVEILSSSIFVKKERSADGLPRITEKIYRIGETVIAVATIREDGRNTHYRVNVPGLGF